MKVSCKFKSIAHSKIHLGVCGSVAAYKAVDVMRTLQKLDCHVSVTLTESATKFIAPLSFSSLGASPLYNALFSPSETPFEHLEPGTFADSFAVIPASATTLARVASGLADNMLSAQALSFTRSLLFFPAMNPRMWENKATQRNIQLLSDLGHTIISPDCGDVACGEYGSGKLLSVDHIVFYILRDCIRAKGEDSLTGKKVLVTLGPTRESWDDVRVWTNLSTGYMGASIAYAAWLRGADVYAIAGPGTPELPPDIHAFSCVSAHDMFEVASSLWEDMDMGFFTAAVADYTPVPYGKGKFKKGERGAPSVAFAPTQDILATLGHRKAQQKILGFAAETSDLERNTKNKLLRKNADVMVGNLVTPGNSTFGSPVNTAYVCRRSGVEEQLPELSKEDLAWRLIDELCAI